jgi:hypothetical protein
MDVIEERYISNDQGDWRIRLVPDDDTNPTEYECYVDGDIRAWRSDEWRYVGVIVNDENTGTSSSVWAVEYGRLPDAAPIGMDQIIEEYFDDLRADVAAELVERAAELAAQ